MHSVLIAPLLLTLSAPAAPFRPPQQSTGCKFVVPYPTVLGTQPFSGSVVLYFSKNSGQPRNGPNWFNPEPIFSTIVAALKPGESVTFVDGKLEGFPKTLAEVPAGKYNVQVVFDRNLGGRTIGGSPGNIYSKTSTIELDPSKPTEFQIICDQIIPERTFKETTAVKELRVESKLLSKHYGRPTFISGAVVLPEGYEAATTTRFPVIYSVPGFGGTHYESSGRTSSRGTLRAGQPFIMVNLNPDCPTGHSVFADSANNGPWGTALTTEFIPELEKRFRTISNSRARLVTGHSSGGWSSFWLQVAYPDTFGGCWSTSPDPIDFRDFQQINLYRKGENMFKDAKGAERPIARFGTEVAIYYRRFSDMERAIRGEQLGSFEGVFSPIARDGQPAKLWNRDTGEIDAKVAEYWKKYDIGLILRTKHKELAPKLRGKIRCYTGNEDTFYLEGAVKLVKKDIAGLGYEEKIEVFPGDHGSVMTRELRDRIDREMAEAVKGVK